MKPAQAKIYLEVVLLDAIREDIASNKKLNVHYYECLKRALYKPAAFFKGIVFPLLNVRTSSRKYVILTRYPDWVHVKRSSNHCICCRKTDNPRTSQFRGLDAHLEYGLHR